MICIPNRMRAFIGVAIVLVGLAPDICPAQLQIGGRGPISLPQKKRVSAPTQSPSTPQSQSKMTAGQLRQLAAAYNQMSPKERKQLTKALKQQLKQQAGKQKQ